MDAVVVHDVDKKFGLPNQLLWKRLLRPESQNGSHNGNGNGHSHHLLPTHDMNEAEMLCDRIAMMDSGRVLALDTPADLKQRIPAREGKELTREDVFLELTGKKLVNPEEESLP